MGQVKLEKQEKRKPLLNNWVKFFMADILVSLGIWSQGCGLTFPAAFGIIGGLGILLSMLGAYLSEAD